MAERLQAKQHGVVALITRCEAAGLVRRQVSESDRRSVEVWLTGQGLACLHELAALHRVELSSLRGQFVVPVTPPVVKASVPASGVRATWLTHRKKGKA